MLHPLSLVVPGVLVPPLLGPRTVLLLSNAFYYFGSGYKFGLVIVLFKVSASRSKKAEQAEWEIRSGGSWKWLFFKQVLDLLDPLVILSTLHNSDQWIWKEICPLYNTN